MKVLIQRVKQAEVEVDGKCCGNISKGLLLYVCFEQGDETSHIQKAVKKISALRVFPDSQERMNLNINDIGGEILSVSQFTLSWNGQKGNRPSFELSMPPKKAEEMYNVFNKSLQTSIEKPIQTGIFAADMKVKSINDGPVTFFLEF